MAKKKNRLMDEAKDTMKLGVTSMAAGGVFGAMGNIPGMPAQAKTTSGVAMSGLTLLNVGQLGKSSMAVVDTLSPSKKKKSTGDRRLDKMLGK